VRIIPVVKMSSTGNDFLMVDNWKGVLAQKELAKFARAACPRRVSAGADGVILVEKSGKPDHAYRMRIFNADGSEAEMCGNGSRCVAVFANHLGLAGLTQTIETLAGTLHASVTEDGRSAKVQLSQPNGMETKQGLDVLGVQTDLSCINTGVPHAVQFVADVAQVNLKARGAAIRHHDAFKPKGTNADFVQLLGQDTIRLRTYERGVEDETFACGTGATASAIVASLVHGYKSPVKVITQSRATLTIHFDRKGDGVTPPFLEGAVDTVYKGEFYWQE
jgi:diaminopimelate epimerase